MPDLEQRLRDDAARTTSGSRAGLDFADALQAAVSRPAGRSRWSVVAVAGAAAAVLVVGGSIALLRHHATPDHTPASTHTTGAPAPETLSPVGAIVEPGSDAPWQLLVIARNPADRCAEPMVRVRETRSKVRVQVMQNSDSHAPGAEAEPPAARLP